MRNGTYLVKKIQYGQLLDRMERLLFFGKRKEKENGKEKDTRTEEEKTADVMGQMLSFFKKLDVEQMQHHLANVTSAIGSVQQVFQQFQGKRTQQEEYFRK